MAIVTWRWVFTLCIIFLGMSSVTSGLLATSELSWAAASLAFGHRCDSPSAHMEHLGNDKAKPFATGKWWTFRRGTTENQCQ